MKFVGKVVAAVLIAVLVLILLVVGCSALVLSSDEGQVLTDEPGVVKVQAPKGKCWSGAIGDSSKDGCGPAEFPVDEQIIVANAQKVTEGKWKLVLTLSVDGERVDSSETTAEFGIAQVSE